MSPFSYLLCWLRHRTVVDPIQITAQKRSPENPTGHYETTPLGEEQPRNFLAKCFLLLKTPSILGWSQASQHYQEPREFLPHFSFWCQQPECRTLMKGSGGLRLRLFDKYCPCTSLEGAIAKSSLLAFHRPEQKPLLLLGLGFQRLFWQMEHNSCSAMQGSSSPRGGGCSKAWCPVPSPAPTSCLPPPHFPSEQEQR